MRGNYQNNHLAMKMAPDTDINVSRPYKVLHYTLEHTSETHIAIYNLKQKGTDSKR